MVFCRAKKFILENQFAYKRTLHGLSHEQAPLMREGQRQALEKFLQDRLSAPTNTDEKFDFAFTETTVYLRKSEITPRL